jgi:peptidoglycan/xylan/chitin deacetylase (PgdA/CDA1 family)
MTAQMKPKWIIPFSLLFLTTLLLGIYRIYDVDNLQEVFASTNQAHPVEPLPTSEQNFKKYPNTKDSNQNLQECKKSTSITSDKDIISPQNFNKQPAPFEQEKINGEITQPVNTEKNHAKEEQQAEVKTKKIYLTFDDGPSPTTGLLLDILQEYQAKATFFLLEPRMTVFPDDVIRLAAEGHGLALHGVTHNRELFYQSPETALAEMKQAQATLANLTGISTKLARTPYGSKPNMTDSHLQVMKKEDFIIWDWNVDSRDWYFKDSRLVEHTISQIKVLEEKGQEPIILLHDINHTAEHLPQLLTYLKDNQYEFDILNTSMEAVLLQ